MNIAVVGSSGYIGGYLVEKLEGSGHSIARMSSSSGGIDPSTGLFPREWTVPVGTEAVVYCSQSPHYRAQPEKLEHLINVNVTSAGRACAEAVKAGAKTFVYFSTGSVYSPSFEPYREDSKLTEAGWYPTSKILGERLVREFANKISLIVVRPFGVFGPGQKGMLIPNLTNSIKEGKSLSLQGRSVGVEDGGARLSLITVNDCVKLVERLIARGQAGEFNLTSSTALSIREIGEALGSGLGVTPRFESAPQPRTANTIGDVERLLTAVGPFDFENISAALINLGERDAGKARTEGINV